MITRVTITGADRSIHPEQLAQFSEKYPFVEWGILASRKQMDSPRFPGPAWLIELARVKYEFDRQHFKQRMNLSLHLCGAYVREVFRGNYDFMHELPINLFDRIQLNTHGEPHEWDVVGVERIMGELLPEKEFIFQYDNVNTDLLEIIAKRDKVKNFSALYDLSHGAGILPKQWPAPLAYCKTGYAGGLGPMNLDTEMQKILTVVKSSPYRNVEKDKNGDLIITETEAKVWIDMETHVRSGQSLEKFDPENVHDALKIAEKYMKE